MIGQLILNWGEVGWEDFRQATCYVKADFWRENEVKEEEYVFHCLYLNLTTCVLANCGNVHIWPDLQYMYSVCSFIFFLVSVCLRYIHESWTLSFGRGNLHNGTFF